MIVKPDHFSLEELVCPHVYYRYGEMAWGFYDPRQFILIDWVRNRYGPVFINNWYEQYRDSDYIRALSKLLLSGQPVIESQLPARPELMLPERGLRCNICSLYLEKTSKGIIYMSGHGLAKADDMDVQGRTAEEVRWDILKNKNTVPFPLRMEKNKSWLHLDCEDNLTGDRVTLFDA